MREYIFDDLKYPSELGYKPKIHLPLTDQTVKIVELKIASKIIFEKAQNEKKYCAFYAELCLRIIKLELNLKGKNFCLSNIKDS
jgi:hypothetical protein